MYFDIFTQIPSYLPLPPPDFLPFPTAPLFCLLMFLILWVLGGECVCVCMCVQVNFIRVVYRNMDTLH